MLTVVHGSPGIEIDFFLCQQSITNRKLTPESMHPP
jgi:hypothetical protein